MLFKVSCEIVWSKYAELLIMLTFISVLAILEAFRLD